MKGLKLRKVIGIFIAFLSLAIILSCCRRNYGFYREKEIFHFLETKNVHFSSQNSILMLLIGSSCETCLEATKDILKRISEVQAQNLIIILGDDLAKQEYYQLIRNSSNLTIISTNVDTLSAKGLLLQGDGIFFINKSNQIAKLWSITFQNKSKIIRELEKKKYHNY
jgi:hypothetical protein